jgi:single-strand selective monofunctional uracil DNA glycosylase
MTNPLQRAAKKLARDVDSLAFSLPVTHVYNPLVYAWRMHSAYLEAYGKGTKKILLLGMNPGPWGMAQTGVPFGEVSVVRDWMKLDAPVRQPPVEHPKRPVEGLSCGRSEVSGKRLWGLFAEKFKSPEAFFRDHLVVNYCPLVFMAETGRNITPDKLPAGETEALRESCDRHLRAIVKFTNPEWIVAVGTFAETRIRAALDLEKLSVGRILHPSPASPLANRDWAGTASRQLVEQGIWKSAHG